MHDNLNMHSSMHSWIYYDLLRNKFGFITKFIIIMYQYIHFNVATIIIEGVIKESSNRRPGGEGG